MTKILITGATGSIGSALALEYATKDTQLILQGRNAGVLGQVAEKCRSQGAEVSVVALDLSDRTALEQWLDETLNDSVPDLVFANAGMNINTGPYQAGESWEATEQLLELNVRSTFYLVHRLALAMKQKGRGQLVLLSSLAAWFGLPVTPAYSGSKAAVKAYGEGLRGWLNGSGVSVTVVMPGYVSSAMCDAMPGPKPFLWKPERAAGFIRTRVERRRARVSFPFPLNWGTWWLAVLPAALSHRILRLMGFGG
ncbi:SDR family NAD(P)-dependent oxidoreductase [Marinobacterium lutimaris]|uniref:Short-chain dehydrogenase n=1 Tax=Marinobacterium lutimaris TaxID=568106 RepID=A0A1H6B331_9GAMM|nr:SDR family NAD(P)-dependent oxidoreductase [Marinobacterium lutimaris]SEG55249.1 Short-chain dehydrogenase [Marinobacterium lutimaris]